MLPITDEMREMMEAQDRKKAEGNALAGEILELARQQLMLAMRFLDRALFRMPIFAADTVSTYGVNGRLIYFQTEHVLSSYKEEENRPTRAFLHMVLHCIFSHPFQYEKMERALWDFSCDVAVEQAILELNVKDTLLDDDPKRLRELERFHREVPLLTAEKIYRFLSDNPDRAEEWLSKAPLFEQDDHIHWIPLKEEKQDGDRSGDTLTTDTRTAMIGCHEADTGEEGEQAEDIDEALVGQSQDDWADISQHAKTDLEMFSKEKGFGAGSLLWNIKEALREKYDYGAFLKKFAALGEEMHINDDEFDYIYYTYGLELYDNMPLIEPLEYRENKRIREFVIALDTSGSCQGATVEKFLRKTHDILKNTESYFKRVNLHIIQCDTKIQQDVRLCSDEEFDAYMQNIELSGFGGTDFRPVFAYVDEMIARHEFHDLKGLIYFTDGHGTFPERPPAYETAFVFLEEGFAIPQVPPWAIKLVLHEDEI